MTISKREFEKLALAHGEGLISICVPTHRKGPEIDQDRIRVKNLIAEAEKRIEAEDLDKRAVGASIESLRRVFDEQDFWRHQGDGLALHALHDALLIHRLSHAPEETLTIGRRFCVRPMLRSVADESRFFILVLSQKQVRLLDCTRSSVREVDAHDVPESLRDAIGYDWEQKSLQFHTRAQRVGAANTRRAAIFHGQGGGTDEDNEELEQFILRVDRAVTSLLQDRAAPLVIAAVEREIAMYQNITRYDPIIPDGLRGNHEHRSNEEIHADALPLVQEQLSAAAERDRERLAQAAHSARVVSGVEQSLRACRAGRVHELFVAPERPVWGRFHDDDRIEVHEERRPGDEDLLNLTIAFALESGGEVFPASTDDLPNRLPVAALTRF